MKAILLSLGIVSIGIIIMLVCQSKYALDALIITCFLGIIYKVVTSLILDKG